MSSPDVSSCKPSMLWNWNTVDACFVADSWHVHTTRQYALSLLGFFVFTLLLEAFCRTGRAYDRLTLRLYQNALAGDNLTQNRSGVGALTRSDRPYRPTFLQQLARSLFFVVQLAAGYFLMLAVMSYNGGVIFSILAGGFVGHLIFARDTVPGATAIETADYGVFLEQVTFGGGKQGMHSESKISL
ncbi:unnamed protein product [Mycena citricolor]|uniref:Copper transport protein n=1 Tax=Mycena citricolor TaxID=2018698 RepID=A0AAD2I1L4_9AGAR|nr:unnamed protein product [Mycena citricolor]